MARNSDNAAALVDGFVYVAVKGSTMPTGVADPIDAAFKDTGWLTDAGIGETPSNSTNQKRAINGTVIKVIKQADDTSFTFECYERNAVTVGLMRPGSTPTTSGSTPEQQTITITGSPTGGTFTPNVPGFGALPAQPYNVALLTLATALSGLVNGTVTVSGTPGTSYVVTFPSSLGNVGQMTVAAGLALTGGTSPSASVATGTPGVAGGTTTPVKASLISNEKAFILVEDYGTWQRRALIAKGEAFLTGTLQDKPGDLPVMQFRIDCYPDSTGIKYIDITNNPAEAVS